jgi:putative toxin-antitoxin system antitoxin component (TIGR02293 family)
MTNYSLMKNDQLNEAFVRYESLGNGNIIHLIHFARTGLSYAHFQQLSRNTPFSMKEWSEILHLSERTIQRYKKDGLAFESLQSERILEIALLQRKGIEVFGSAEGFFTWLKSVNVALGGITPRELLDNSFGIGLLKDELLRIEHGILA